MKVYYDFNGNIVKIEHGMENILITDTGREIPLPKEIENAVQAETGQSDLPQHQKEKRYQGS